VFAAAGAVLVAAGIAIALLSSGSRRHGAAHSKRAQTAAALRPLPSCGAACDPIDSAYLTDLRFGSTSLWIQPWRAYLDTWPASRLLDAVGINFNVHSPEARAVARLLHDSGFVIARVGTNWGGLSYADPTKFTDEADLERRLLALREYGLRPLLVLDANSGAPCPALRVRLQTVGVAPAGSRTVVLAPASAAQVVPGKTGFAAVNFNASLGARNRHARKQARARANAGLTPQQRRARRRALRSAERSRGLTRLVLTGDPAILITKVGAGGVATLSRPLPFALQPGAHKGSTLLYAPFQAPMLPGGAPNPTFEATLHGWLTYVGTVARVAKRIFGAGGFDLEVWNELGFGSEFLDASKYYSPAPATITRQDRKDIIKTILRETVAYVRDPAHGLSPAVGVSNGFASQSPFPSGAFAPAGLTAISKHPYAGPKTLPQEFQTKPGRIPYDALGRRDTAGPRGSAGAFTPLFVPRFQSLFPEFFLTADSPETLIRDVAPITTRIYKAPHGRFVSTGHGPPLQVWVTEYNLGFKRTAAPVGPDETTPQPAAVISAADRAHFQAKALLRSLVALVNKGVAREYFFAAASNGNLSMISKGFLAAAEANPGGYPGDAAGGETMAAFHNMLTRFAGPGPGPGGARQLKLLAIAQHGSHAQFAGDGTSAHPSLYDREVLAVLPFQSSPTRFVIPVYVMTRDLLTLYRPSAPGSDVRRFDLPDETFRITLGNLPPGGAAPSISSYDPLLNRSTPARLLSRSGSQATIAIAATDYPRILTIQYPGS
jgi:hypothetical protein